MNDFVMSVVNEVLHKSDTSSKTAVVPNNNQELIRPNYQRQSSKKRLMVYDLPPAKQDTGLKSGLQSDSIQALRIQNMATVLTNVTNTDIPNANVTNENIGNTNDKYRQEATLQKNSISSRSKDSLKDFNVCSFGNNKQLKRLLGFPYSSNETACIGMQENCFLSQLFAVNEVLNRMPALDFSIQWSLNNGDPFVFQAIGSQDNMNTAANILNSSCIKTKGILMVKQSSAYLKKRLNNSANTIGTIEGVPFAKLLPSVAAYSREHPDCMLEYQIFGSYLLASGQAEEVEQFLKFIL